MLASFPAALLALPLLVGTTASAQPLALPCETGTRRIELKAEPAGEAPELCIGPGVSTTIIFHGAELLPGGITLDGRERFTLVDAGSTMLRLEPSEGVMPGERFRLIVRFKDGAAPASIAFRLGVYAGKVEPLVEVYREKRTLASYQHEIQEKETQLHQCREVQERLRAEKESPGGLTGLLATGLLDDRGLLHKNIFTSIGKRPGNFAQVFRAISYRSTRTVAIVLWLEVPDGIQPWRAVSAELVGRDHRALRVQHPWQSTPLTFGSKEQRVVIEAEATEEETQGSFTLKVWGEDGTRNLIISGITFP
ncbi:DUF2381 family protein [Hyalangium versicolor]|uniref:DUF2381 family protein n=1 Tax=Hyalangium versicolor TaxID=2861190 RepID=UPI001CCB4635|nr:DUF2381 family protein [Hyalangium versicolor]